MNAVDDLFNKQSTKDNLTDRRKRLSEMLLKEKQEEEVSDLMRLSQQHMITDEWWSQNDTIIKEKCEFIILR